MNSIPLEQLATKPQDEDIDEFIESVPDREAISLKQAILETGITSRQRWIRVADIRAIERFINNKPCIFFVNSKTAKEMQDG